jgi:hypothetical protein
VVDQCAGIEIARIQQETSAAKTHYYETIPIQWRKDCPPQLPRARIARFQPDGQGATDNYQPRLFCFRVCWSSGRTNQSGFDHWLPGNHFCRIRQRHKPRWHGRRQFHRAIRLYWQSPAHLSSGGQERWHEVQPVRWQDLVPTKRRLESCGDAH